MSKSNRIFLIVGRVLFGLFLVYLFVLPALALLLGSGGGGEFDGLWIIILFPQLILLTGKGFGAVVSISSDIISLIAISSFVLLFVLKFLIKIYLKFNIGYCWSIMFSLVLAIVSVALVNAYIYPYSSESWTDWATEAVAQNNPGLCIEKVDPYYQKYCLENAAMETGDVSYCEKIIDTKEDGDGINAYYVDSCKTQLALIWNVSEKFCDTEYDYDCVFSACDNELNDENASYSGCSNAILNGYFNFYINDLVVSTGDASLCDLYEGVPDEQAQKDLCLTGVSKE